MVTLIVTYLHTIYFNQMYSMLSINNNTGLDDILVSFYFIEISKTIPTNVYNGAFSVNTLLF